MPVGVSLSGGIDSSSIVAMLRRTTSGPIKTFSLGFDEPTDETDDARFVARTFGTEHHEVVLHEPALAHLADAIWHTEEPKVNSLQLYLLHRFIGEHVSVVLSGLGGDELFAGYDIYGYLLRTRRLRGRAARRRGPRAWRPPWTGRRAGPRAWAGRNSTWPPASWSGSPPPATGPATTCCSATPGTSTPRCCGACTPPSSSSRLEVSTRDDYERPLRGRRGRWRARPCGPSSRPRWCAICCTTRTPCRWRTRSSPASRCSTSNWSGSPPASRTASASAAGPKGCSRTSLTGVLPDRVLHKRKWGFTFDPVEQYQKDLGPMAREMLITGSAPAVRYLQSRRSSGLCSRQSPTSAFAGTISCSGR